MIWPKPSPQSLMGIMGLFMIGCVSISTHERMKHEEYVKGRINGMQTSLAILRGNKNKENAVSELKELLGCSETW